MNSIFVCFLLLLVTVELSLMRDRRGFSMIYAEEGTGTCRNFGVFFKTS